MSATADKLVVLGGQKATRGIDDNSSASSSTSLVTLGKAKAVAQSYADTRANGIVTFNGSSSASSLATSYSTSVMTITLTSFQAANQAFNIASATSHSSISSSDTVNWVFPAGTTGVKTFHLSGAVAGKITITSSASVASVAKSANMVTALLTGGGVIT